MAGKVYLVGAGPGDPALLTLRGKRAIERADCVIFDFLVNEALLRFARRDCERIFAGKRSGRHAMAQEQINRVLVERALAGEMVVRLKGGDPFIFGRGGEEAAALAEAGVAFEIVPGVSAGSAAPAYAGIPLTHRGLSSSVRFITGHEEGGAISSPNALPSTETLVIFMGTRNLREIAATLIRQGRDPATPASVIRWGTTPSQEVIAGPLSDIGSLARDVHPPALAVIGEVVKLRERLAWFEKLPLFGKLIVITRPQEQSAALAAVLAERGAQPIELPTIELRDPPSWDAMDAAVGRLDQFQFLLATSANGVRRFMDRLAARGLDSRALKGIEIGAIGPATAAEFARHGVRADFVPPEYQGEGLLEALAGRDLSGKSFLIPRARVARDLVPRVLRERGARVEVVEAYYAAAPEYRPDDLEALLTPVPHVITFTSSSTAANFTRLPIPAALRDKLRRAQVASIGPVTSGTLRSLGMNVDIEASKSTVASLIEAVESYYGQA